MIVMDAASLTRQIFQLAKLIYDQTQLVNVNRAQCVLLGERVQTVQSAIKKLGKIADSEAYRLSLGRLKTCLQEAYGYMQGLSSEKWYQQFLRARNHQETFQQFHARLAESIVQLNLGLSVQTILNREEDQKAQHADHETLLKKQDEILRLNQTLLSEVKQLPNQSFHERQMAALKSQLQALMVEIKSVRKITPSLGLDAKIVIPYYELSLEKAIGEGSFGTVYLGRWHENPVAIKLWNGVLSSEDEQRFIREVQIVQHLNTPRYVPQFYGACLEGGQACLVMEYCELGSLYDYLPTHRLTPTVQHHLALSLAQSLQFLHQRKIIHRDLKSANILLMASSDLLTVKITDFGLSKAHYPSIASTKDMSRALAWCAPEILQGEKATYAADVFSAGMVLWEIFTGRRPFTGRTSLKEWIISGKQESCEEIPKKYAELIMRCWASDSHARPSAAELATALQTILAPEPTSEERISTLELPKPVALPEISFPSATLSMTVVDEKKLSPGDEAYKNAKYYHEQKDYANARKHYEIAWLAGINKAGNKLATLLIRGHGGAKDEARAVRLFTQLAESGDVLAMSNLAQAYRHGVGVVKDTKQALSWQKRYDQATQSSSPSKPASNSVWGKGSPGLLAKINQIPSIKNPVSTTTMSKGVLGS
jgi:serine/threonine protein kinase